MRLPIFTDDYSKLSCLMENAASLTFFPFLFIQAGHTIGKSMVSQFLLHLTTCAEFRAWQLRNFCAGVLPALTLIPQGYVGSLGNAIVR